MFLPKFSDGFYFLLSVSSTCHYKLKSRALQSVFSVVFYMSPYMLRFPSKFNKFNFNCIYISLSFNDATQHIKLAKIFIFKSFPFPKQLCFNFIYNFSGNSHFKNTFMTSS